MGSGWGKLTQFLVEDEYQVLVIFNPPGSVHPVNHFRVGAAYLLRDEIRGGTDIYYLNLILNRKVFGELWSQSVKLFDLVTWSQLNGHD